MAMLSLRYLNGVRKDIELSDTARGFDLVGKLSEPGIEKACVSMPETDNLVLPAKCITCQAAPMCAMIGKMPHFNSVEEFMEKGPVLRGVSPDQARLN